MTLVSAFPLIKLAKKLKEELARLVGEPLVVFPLIKLAKKLKGTNILSFKRQPKCFH